MKFDKVIFMETIPTGSFSNYKMGVEGTLEPGESIEEAFKQAKEKIVEAYKGINPGVVSDFSNHAYGLNVTSPIHLPFVDYKAKEEVEDAIHDATSIELLAKAKEGASQYGLMSQYMSKLKSLS